MCTRDETSCLSSKILILAHSCSLSSQQMNTLIKFKKRHSMSEPTSFKKFLKWNKTKMKLSAYFMKSPVHTSICRCLISCSFYVINFSHAPKSCVGLCVVQVGGNQDQLCLYVCICCFRTMHMLIQLHCICSAGLVEIMLHPPYSQVMAADDFFLLQYLKNPPHPQVPWEITSSEVTISV